VKIRLFRIDAHHASYGDDRGSELLEPTEQWSYSGRSTNWSGSVPGKSVIHFLSDSSGRRTTNARPLRRQSPSRTAVADACCRGTFRANAKGYGPSNP
jgi:hypothetical protein